MCKKTISVLGVGLLLLGLASVTEAALIDRGAFNNGFGGTVNLIYDEDRDITWLGDANFAQTSGVIPGGSSTWQTAVDFAANLTVGGYTDWRLPSAFNQDGSGPCGAPQGGLEFECTGSEMGHLFYDELGGRRNQPVTTQSGRTEEEIDNQELFRNIRFPSYWSSTEFGANAGIFNFGNGNQTQDNKGNVNFAWAVRSGDVAAVPAPSAMLLMATGTIGLLIWRRKRND